ncbi:MAG: hypothetical protein V9G98_26090 [Candidatus Competibacter sp.]
MSVQRLCVGGVAERLIQHVVANAVVNALRGTHVPKHEAPPLAERVVVAAPEDAGIVEINARKPVHVGGVNLGSEIKRYLVFQIYEQYASE